MCVYSSEILSSFHPKGFSPIRLEEYQKRCTKCNPELYKTVAKMQKAFERNGLQLMSYQNDLPAFLFTASPGDGSSKNPMIDSVRKIIKESKTDEAILPIVFSVPGNEALKNCVVIQLRYIIPEVRFG